MEIRLGKCHIKGSRKDKADGGVCLSEFSTAGVAWLIGNPNAVLGAFWKA